MRAKNGPSGKAATNSVTKPYWITGKNKNKKNKKQKNKTEFITSKSQPSPSLNRTSCAVLTHLEVFIKQPVHGILSQVIVQFPTCVFGQVGGFNILTASPPVLKLSVENNYNNNINLSQIPSEFSRENMISSYVKITCYSLHVEKIPILWLYYYKAAWCYEISLHALNISLVRFAHSWNISQHSNRINYLRAAM